MRILSVKNITKNFGDLVAVNDISFNIEKGEIFALIGPNGAGKSTVLKLISTILKPTKGTVLLNDNDIIKNPEYFRQNITYLPEEAGAYKNMKGIDYLKYMASLYSQKECDVNDFVDYAKRICNLDERLNDKVGTYSKGMTRKLLLARAIMTKPTLAILDEPTSGLDIINALHIREIIKGLTKTGMTVLLSSHNMLEIEFLSDRVGIINEGKLIEVGSHDALLKEYKAKNLEEVFSKLTT